MAIGPPLACEQPSQAGPKVHWSKSKKLAPTLQTERTWPWWP